MKKLNIAIALALGLVLPFTAMAAPADNDEVTIRMMNMNEYSADKLTQNIELPAAASENATGLVRAQERKTVRNRTGEQSGIPYEGEGPGESQGTGEGPDAGNHYAGDGPGEPHGIGEGPDAGDGPGSIDAPGEGVGEMDRTRDQDQLQIHEQDQDRVMDQDQDRTMEQDQDQLRDPIVDKVFDNDPTMEQQAPDTGDLPMEQQQNEIGSPAEQPAEPAATQQ